MQNMIRIVAAVVDTEKLTLYKADGTTVIIPQGDVRVRKIIDLATPLLLEQKYADVDIGVYEDNHFAQFEEKSSGVVRLFRIAKEKLKGFFGVKPVENQIVGALPEFNPEPVEAATSDERVPVPVKTPEEVAKVEQTKAALDEIMAHAVPVSSEHFTEEGVYRQGNVREDNGSTNKEPTNSEEPNTIIAVVDNKVIPGMELMKTQFARATKRGSTTAVENFLKRLTSVIDHRSHSVDDLLKFMERADLPIAEDGTILIYKILQKTGEGKYVDCHTKKVEQWVGAYVCMDPSLVDHNRNNECSNGLHVARRGYLGSFSGNVCVLAKLAPEDVIAVPTYDANKMRVCGYHIIKELSQEHYQKLRSNQAITNTDAGKQLIADALAGKHTHRTHEVRIGAHAGGNVTVKKLTGEAKEVPVVVPVAKEEAVALPDKADVNVMAPAVDPRQVDKQQTLGRKEQAAILYAEYQKKTPGATEALLAYKKAAKVSWEKLGIPEPAEAKVKKPSPLKGTKVPAKVDFSSKTTPKIDFTKAKDQAVQARAAKTLPKKAPAKDAWPKHIAATPKPKKEKPVNVQTADTPASLDHGFESVKDILANTSLSPVQKARKFITNFRDHFSDPEVATALLQLKKEAKKSWEYFGLTEAQVCLVTTAAKKKAKE